MTYGFKHAPDFTVPSFRKRHLVPAVRALTTACFQGSELGRAIVQQHAIEQTLFLIIAQSTQYPDSIFTLKAKTWVHQLVSQLPGACQKQQALGIEVKSSDRLPLPLKKLGQATKDSGSILRVVVSHNLARWLVIRNHARWRWVNTQAHRFAIHFDCVAELDTLADVRRLCIHRNTPLQDELLHFQARSQTRLGQHFMQFR